MIKYQVFQTLTPLPSPGLDSLIQGVPHRTPCYSGIFLGIEEGSGEVPESLSNFIINYSEIFEENYFNNIIEKILS
jgi:hypothetical protein